MVRFAGGAIKVPTAVTNGSYLLMNSDHFPHYEAEVDRLEHGLDDLLGQYGDEWPDPAED